MEFKLSEVEKEYDDTCEQCDSQKKPVYRLKGHEDNLDTMICRECLLRLQKTINNFKI